MDIDFFLNFYHFVSEYVNNTQLKYFVGMSKWFLRRVNKYMAWTKISNGKKKEKKKFHCLENFVRIYFVIFLIHGQMITIIMVFTKRDFFFPVLSGES